MAKHIETLYLGKIYDTKKFKRTVDNTVKAVLKQHKTKRIDAIAFTGTSGAAVAYPVSYITGIPLLCVRKKIQSSHYAGQLEGYINPRNYVIIDDFICTGASIKRIIRYIKDESPKSKLSCVILYNHRSNKTNFSEEFNVPIVGMK